MAAGLGGSEHCLGRRCPDLHSPPLRLDGGRTLRPVDRLQQWGESCLHRAVPSVRACFYEHGSRPRCLVHFERAGGGCHLHRQRDCQEPHQHPCHPRGELGQTAPVGQPACWLQRSQHRPQNRPHDQGGGHEAVPGYPLLGLLGRPRQAVHPSGVAEHAVGPNLQGSELHPERDRRVRCPGNPGRHGFYRQRGDRRHALVLRLGERW